MLACPCPSGEFFPLQKAPAHRFPCCLWISSPCVGPVGTRTSHIAIWTLWRVRGTRREGAGIADGTSGLRVPSRFPFSRDVLPGLIPVLGRHHSAGQG